MWVFLSNAFLSIVDPNPEAPAEKATVLLVRGRLKGDIESVFPDAKVTTTPDRDYRFRALIAREKVAQAISEEVTSIGYGNFKDTVRNAARHDAYLNVWGNMNRAQIAAAPKPKAKRGGKGDFDHLIWPPYDTGTAAGPPRKPNS